MASHAYAVNYMSHLASLDFVSRAPPFTILPRDARGKPGSKYPPGDPPHVTAAINICRRMLTYQSVRDAFSTLAIRYSFGRSNSWYLQGSSPMSMEQVTNTFIEKILATFPIVFIDYSLGNPDSKGFHTRRPWDGNFEPGKQAISINGKRADQMSTAFEKATDENSQHLLRAFLFLTAHVFLHEIGHVFVTYLTKGQELTPPQISALSMYVPGSNGEAGRALEELVCGGTIHFVHEPVGGTPDGQCGTAFLQKPSGANYRILRATIDATASYQFKFPYDHDESAEPEELRLLGEGLEPDTFTDPLERGEVAYLL